MNSDAIIELVTQAIWEIGAAVMGFLSDSGYLNIILLIVGIGLILFGERRVRQREISELAELYAKAALAAIPADEWQPIETAKCIGKKRLMFALSNGKIATGFRLAGSSLVLPEGAESYYLATHWRPLPAPPQEQEPTDKQPEA